jgi:hypothetical protein
MTELKFLEEFNNIHKSLLHYGLNSWNIASTEKDLMRLFKQYQDTNSLADETADTHQFELAPFPASTEESKVTEEKQLKE